MLIYFVYVIPPLCFLMFFFEVQSLNPATANVGLSSRHLSAFCIMPLESFFSLEVFNANYWGLSPFNGN